MATTYEGKILATGKLPSSTGDLFTATNITFIRLINLSNAGAGDNEITVFINDGADTQLFSLTLSTKDTLVYDNPIALEPGDKIRGVADNADEVHYVIDGTEQLP